MPGNPPPTVRAPVLDPTVKIMSVLVLKYLVRNFTDKYEAIAAQLAPSRAASIACASFEASSSGSLRAAAAAIIGVAKRNEKRSASS